MENQLAQLLKNTYTVEELNQKLTVLKLDTSTLKSLEQAIEKLPLAIVTLATTLPKEEIRRLGRWFRRNVNPQALLEIRQDKKMVGGCRIIWQGVEEDFSLRRKFQHSFATPLRQACPPTRQGFKGQAAMEGEKNG